MSPAPVFISKTRFPSDLAVVRRLLGEYAGTLDPELLAQDFTGELDALPDQYIEPNGQMLLAWCGDEAVGCIGLRRVDARACEMKRLYVRPQSRGRKIGSLLVERICIEARDAGYTRMRLATLGSMTCAHKLYRAAGFLPVQPFVPPLPGSLFFEREL